VKTTPKRKRRSKKSRFTRSKPRNKKGKNDAKNDAQRKADSLARKRHAKQTQARFQTEELAIREIKLTQNKNGRY
jgi:hypothetical protein